MRRPLGSSPTTKEYDLTQEATEVPPDHAMLKPHPLADKLPAMSEAEYRELVTDIEQNGILQPIVLLDGMILDGIHRYNAWTELLTNMPDLRLPKEQYTGDDPAAFVLSTNVKRRMLNATQLGMVLAEIAPLRRRGRPRKVAPDDTAPAVLTQRQLARVLNVSEDTGQRAKKVLEQGSKTLIERAKRGEITAALASRVADMPLEEQASIDTLPPPEMANAWRRRRRQEKEESLAHVTAVATVRLGKAQYGVIYASPPWRTSIIDEDLRARVGGYTPRMSTDEIAALKVPAAKNCAAFVWVAPTLLGDGMHVLSEWGFKYRSHLVWHGDRIGSDPWVKSQHELLLIGTKGEVAEPTADQRWESVQPYDTPKLGVKPKQFREQIEAMFPNTPRLAMFIKGAPVPGWSVWDHKKLEAA